MEYTTLGRTGVKVSKLCFGTMSFGGDADEETSAAMFNCCREAGINFFDCANIYQQGLAEEILGRLIKGSRDQLVITSKVCSQMGDDRNGRGLSRRHIMLAVEDSLRRLGTDRLDIYFCHMFDPATAMEETLRALDDLVRRGKILYIGISNFSAWKIAKAQGICKQLGLAPVSTLQPMYSLAKRTAEIEILPLAKSENLAVIPYSPLGGGLLTGKYSTTKRYKSGRLTANKMYASRYAADSLYKLAENFTAFAEKACVKPATLAVAWVKANAAVTCPIIGARNLDQLKDSLAAADYQMSPEQYQEISALTPAVPVATDRSEEVAAQPK